VLPNEEFPDEAGASSGLHHDFHDNLYVLLRGCKRFRLYPPTAVQRMYTYGQVRQLYSNGRIVYEGQVKTPCAKLGNSVPFLCIRVRTGCNVIFLAGLFNS
jgi:Cupin-like domain